MFRVGGDNMAYAKVVDGILVEAPRNYKLEDGAIICNFNNDIATMEKHGFKEIKKLIPEFDPEVEIVVFDTVEEKENCVLITYRKEEKPKSLVKRIEQLENSSVGIINRLTNE